MRHSEILKAAMMAAAGASGEGGLDDRLEERLRGLYDYARERNFPPPETLVRKLASLENSHFPFAALSDAPETVQTVFIAFHAVITALEPFHEDDPAEEQMQPEPAELTAPPEPTEPPEPADPPPADPPPADPDAGFDPPSAGQPEKPVDDAADKKKSRK